MSLYSYFAFTYLLTQRTALSSHNVTLEFVPIFIGGIMEGSGNKPPWVNPAKAAYGGTDILHAEKYFGLSGIKKPTIFPIPTLKVWIQLRLFLRASRILNILVEG